jgi:hypothetical protein
VEVADLAQLLERAVEPGEPAGPAASSQRATTPAGG